MIPVNNMPLKRLRNNNSIVKADDQSVTNDASLLVTVGFFDLLKMSICLLMGTDCHKVQRKGIIIIDRKDFVNAVNLIDRVSRNQMMA